MWAVAETRMVPAELPLAAKRETRGPFLMRERSIAREVYARKVELPSMLLDLEQSKTLAGFISQAKALQGKREFTDADDLARKLAKSNVPTQACRQVLDLIETHGKRPGIHRVFGSARQLHPTTDAARVDDGNGYNVSLDGASYDLQAWEKLLPGGYNALALMQDKNLLLTKIEDGSARVKCANHATHTDGDPRAWFGAGDARNKISIYCTNGDEDGSGNIKNPDCCEYNALSMLKAFVAKRVITIADLENVKYGGGPVPVGAAIVARPAGLHRDFIWQDGQIFTVHGKGGQGQERLICGHIDVTARARDEHGTNVGYKIVFRDVFGKLQHKILTDTRLAGEGAGLFTELAAAGLKLNTAEDAARADFRRLLQTWKILGEPVTADSRPGWRGDCFTCPTGEVIRPQGVEDDGRTLNPDVTTVDTRTAGTADDWFSTVSEPSWQGDLPQLALGTLMGVSGVIASLYGGENAGRYLGGASGSGKSTSQAIAASCVANPELGKGVYVAAALTEPELETARVRGHGTCLHIDEAKDAKQGKFVEKLAYAAQKWSGTPYTLSGVKPVHAWVKAAGGDVEEGVEVRLLPSDVGAVPRVDPKRVKAIKAGAATNYGHVLPAFVEEVMRQGLHRDLPALRARVDDYAAQILQGDTDIDADRVAHHFAVLWLVGELMQAIVIIPENADVKTVIIWAWKDWQASRAATRRAAARAIQGGTDVERSLEALDILVATRRGPAGPGRRTQRFGGTMYPLIGPDGDGLGWVDDTGMVYLMTKKIGAIPGNRLSARRLVAALRDAGRLVEPGSDKDCRWARVPGIEGSMPNYRWRLAR